jgi:hypothetical protein
MIIVSGMHRSGTSALAELLGAFGLDLGPPEGLYGGDRWNERGYFEQRDVLDANSEIICGLPRTRGSLARWASQLLYLRMPPRRVLAARARRRTRRLHELRDKYAGRLVKDPRFCLTLADWVEHGAVEKLVVCVRHPAEVADSLWRRQRLPTPLALRFWNYHIEALLEASASLRAAFVRYEDLLCGEPRALAQLDSFFALGLAPAEREARRARVLRESLRHSRRARALPPRTHRLYAELCARCAP